MKNASDIDISGLYSVWGEGWMCKECLPAYLGNIRKTLDWLPFYIGKIEDLIREKKNG